MFFNIKYNYMQIKCQPSNIMRDLNKCKWSKCKNTSCYAVTGKTSGGNNEFASCQVTSHHVVVDCLFINNYTTELYVMFM